MLAGVAGWPIHQSLSPVMHNYWLRRHGLNGSYVALPIAPEHFGQCMNVLPLMGFAGVSVTVPHKLAAFALSSSLDADAEATGAVNTLVFAGNEVSGSNTDVRGFAASLAESLGENAAKAGAAVVLGAGGAARAVVLALARGGAPEIRLLNRTRAKAEAIASSLKVPGRLAVMKWGEWKRAFDEAGLLVNTTSLGMVGKPALEFDLDNLPRAAAVADIVYNPLQTALLKAASERGHRTMDGLGMLMHQAVPAFAGWFGITPSVTPELRAELVKALSNA